MALRDALDEDGKLPCPVAWKLAEEHDLSVRDIGHWANENGVRIRACALGCFQ